MSCAFHDCGNPRCGVCTTTARGFTQPLTGLERLALEATEARLRALGQAFVSQLVPEEPQGRFAFVGGQSTSVTPLTTETRTAA